MNVSTGLTIEDAQQAICHGTLGGKQWTTAGRLAACQRTEGYPLVVVSAASVIVIAAVIVFVVVRRRRGQKRR